MFLASCTFGHALSPRPFLPHLTGAWTQESAEVRISDPDMYQEIVDAEWKIIYDKLEK